MRADRNVFSDPESLALLASLRWTGGDADGALRAYSGTYPVAGGFTNIGMLFTRHRALTLTSTGMQIWKLYSGNSLTTPVEFVPRESIRLDLTGSSYVRLHYGDSGRKLWIDRRWGQSFTDWLSSGS